MKKETPQDYLALALDNVKDTEHLKRIVSQTKDALSQHPACRLAWRHHPGRIAEPARRGLETSNTQRPLR